MEYAWLAFGSAARNELTLASDQDNGLAYADTDDPAVDEYFRRVAEDVNGGLTRCGFKPDSHYVARRHRRVAHDAHRLEGGLLRLPRRQGRRTHGARQRVLRLPPGGRPAVRDPGADRHHARGARAPPLPERAGAPGLRRAPVSRGLRHKVDAWVDIKKGGLLPIQNLARYQAFAHGITIQSTLERLAAVCEVDAEGAGAVCTLREAYLSMKDVQFQHHADAVRAGRTPDNTIVTDALRPLTRANLQEALREVAAAQSRFPRVH